MKIVVLGGAGDMGKEAVRDLAKNEEVEKVLIADYNEDAAKKFKEVLGNKAEAVFVDANDHHNLVDVIKEQDVALSCIGPFYKYETKVARAAIEAKVNYISICDDFDAAEAVLELDEFAKEEGVTVLTGVGWTPGMSNILAKKGIDQLDEAEEVNIAWAGDADDSEGLAVIKHTYHIFTGKIKTYIGGEYLQIPAGSGKEIVEFLPPINKIPVYHLGHPEPITIPRFLPNLKTVTLKGGLTPVWLNPLAKFLVTLRQTNTPQKRDRLANWTKKIMGKISTRGLKISGLRVDVKGIKDGKRHHLVYRAVDRMKRLTGIPAAIGAVILGRGDIKLKGVVAPEACINPDEFIAELNKRGIEIESKEE